MRFTDLHKYVTELEGFADDPAKSNKPEFRAIQSPDAKNTKTPSSVAALAHDIAEPIKKWTDVRLGRVPSVRPTRTWAEKDGRSPPKFLQMSTRATTDGVAPPPGFPSKVLGFGIKIDKHYIRAFLLMKDRTRGRR